MSRWSNSIKKKDLSDQALLYCEYLPNVSSISLILQPVDKIPDHLTALSSTTLYYKLDGESDAELIPLPAHLSKDTHLVLNDKCQYDRSTKTLSLRLKGYLELRRQSLYPLSASKLNDLKSLECKKCNAVVISHIRYLDMPSENWHEMLNFWHCHKPEHDSHHQETETITKDILRPKKSLGLVGHNYILYLREDISNIKVRNDLYKFALLFEFRYSYVVKL
ncbi:ubiquitin-conjugating enzyme E2-binding protein [Dipodascopsis uninucleata]